jgi:hypothetical protein
MRRCRHLRPSFRPSSRSASTPQTGQLHGSAQKAARGFPFPKANGTMRGPLPVLSPPGDASGSFLPWPYAVRVRTNGSEAIPKLG